MANTDTCTICDKKTNPYNNFCEDCANTIIINLGNNYAIGVFKVAPILKEVIADLADWYAEQKLIQQAQG